MSITLSGEIGGLQNILSNKQARGAFGEVQLENLVSDALDPDAYSFQEQLSNKTRADCLIRIPNPPGPIVIDAKFPLEGYNALLGAESEDSSKKAKQKFRTDIKKHIDDIAGKYILPHETADCALMFLPSEAIYAELHSNFRGSIEHGFKSRVFIVSPTTMWALLNTVRGVLRDVKMREQAGLIQKAVGELKRDVEILDDRAEKLSTHFGRAQQSVEKIRTSTSRIVSKSKKIVSVQLEDSGEQGVEVEEVIEVQEFAVSNKRPRLVAG